MKQHQNIKNPFDFAQGKQISKFLKFMFFLFLSAFLILNIFFSQIISPLYYKFVNNNRNSAISFLQKIKVLPEYQKILEMNNDIYGPTVKAEIFAQENGKKDLINNLEQQLIISPKSRDILYSLYQLYLTEGDKNQANDYLKRAKEVDPTVGL